MLRNIIAEETGLSPDKVQEVLDSAVNNMGWDEIKAYNAEIKRGQVYEDAGGYLLRCIGRLFGAKFFTLKYYPEHIKTYQQAVTQMILEGNK